MMQTFKSENKVNDEGQPTGGSVTGTGLIIEWQNGPLGRGEDRKEPNGAFVETVIAAARQRIEFYQAVSGGMFRCEENAQALWHLDKALAYLNLRTLNREARQVEGTHAS